MAKHKKHIDDFFKDHLSDSSLPLSGGEWDAIAKELHPKKKRFILWIWLLPAIVAGAAIFYFSSSNSGSKTSTVQANIPEITSNQTLDNTAALQNHEEFQENNEAETSQLLDNNVELAIEALSPKAIHAKSSNKASSNNTNPIGSKQSSNTSSVSSEPVSTQISDPSLPIVEQPAALTTGKYNELQDLVLLSKHQVSFDYSNAYAFDAILLKGDSGNSTDRTKYVYPPIGPKPILSNLQIGFTIDGLSNNQNLQSTVSDGSSYTKFREQNESSRITSAYNFHVKSSIKSLTAATGLSYVIKGQQLDGGANPSTLTYQIYDSIPYIDIDGNLTYLPYNYRDTSISGNFVSPSYHYVNIPLKLGKTFNITNRFSVEALAEVRVGYLVSTSGTSLNYAIKPTSISASDFNRFNLGTGGSLGLNYKLKNNISFTINANFNTDLSNNLKQEKTSQKFTLYGMGVGIFYSINNK